jgi:MerR family transcriptional regulator, light-induced transcriptional regulator
MSVDQMTISEVAQRTGVPEGTLRMWERRHGFPDPPRLASGHRRYSASEAELVREVAEARAAGIGLSTAIEMIRGRSSPHGRSLFAALRHARPDLEPQLLAKPVLLALAHAIEDESLARAEHPALFATFQRERFYRATERRWRALCSGAEIAVVFANFKTPLTPMDGAAEVPLPAAHELEREWTIVCDSPRHGVCLSAREPAGSDAALPSSRRCFEVMWSVEPDVVRTAARFLGEVAAALLPQIEPRIPTRLAAPAALPTPTQLRLAAGISARALREIAPP